MLLNTPRPAASRWTTLHSGFGGLIWRVEGFVGVNGGQTDEEAEQDTCSSAPVACWHAVKRMQLSNNSGVVCLAWHWTVGLCLAWSKACP